MVKEDGYEPGTFFVLAGETVRNLWNSRAEIPRKNDNNAQTSNYAPQDKKNGPSYPSPKDRSGRFENSKPDSVVLKVKSQKHVKYVNI